ncbi:MAG: hypothetical protein MJZ32_10620 [Bacteroidaceae bacterium]|nr:hypothetical protein [Bacteroidaceae bacterium]
MGTINGAHNTVEALELGIKSLEAYAAKLVEFDQKTKEAAKYLGTTHRDQNYEKFYNTFVPFWKNVDNFKNHVDEYKDYLVIKLGQIKAYDEDGEIDGIN